MEISVAKKDLGTLTRGSDMKKVITFPYGTFVIPSFALSLKPFK
jgi:hypothetical protein